jgi:hypothetical protein
VFGDHFGYDYFEQRHAELLHAGEQARLIRSLERARKEEQGQSPWRRRVLAGVGHRLVTVGTRLQQAGA